MKLKDNIMEKGKFVVSLDFELMWGVRDKKTKTTYGNNIIGVHKIIPKLLEVFKKYKITATFSSVGFLFFENNQSIRDKILKQQFSYFLYCKYFPDWRLL